MNLKRLLQIAQEADNNGDYVTADKVDNLLKTAQMPAMPQMNQQMPQQGGVYNPGMAPGATYYTPGVVNLAKPQMTEEQKAFAKFRGTGIYQSLARSRGVMDQRLQAQAEAEEKAKKARINYGPIARPTWSQGSDTSAPFVPNPNASINPKLYGTGYASMAMAPQQQMPQQPQQTEQPQLQQTYQNLNNYSYNQNYSTPTNQNYYNNAMMQQQQNFQQNNRPGDFYFKSDNGGPIDQSMNIAFGTQNTSANYRDGNPDLSGLRK
jgi:hypothetical protein